MKDVFFFAHYDLVSHVRVRAYSAEEVTVDYLQFNLTRERLQIAIVGLLYMELVVRI